ncbi:MAG: Cytosol aminopeptidase [Chlamydiae bacterium]|nr:Cytosol aminopeptidase [Chlamydiota bacterium]
MDFTSISTLAQRKSADLLAVPFWKIKKGVQPAAELGKLKELLKVPLKTNDFKGKEGEVLIIYVDGQKESRIALVGLGEKKKISLEKLRRAYSKLAKSCLSKKVRDVNLLFPEISNLEEQQTSLGIAEGMLLSNYVFDKLKKDSIKEEPTVLLRKAVLIGAGKKALAAAKNAADICLGVYFARDLVNSNADDVTPQTLGQHARSLAKKFKNVKATVFDKKRIVKEKMGLLLAVNRGSVRDPAFIILEYKGDPKSKDHTVVVGKGITYDTGGLNLKPTGSMETMKCDMSGAAVALGTIYAAATVKLKKNVTAVIPSTENSISAMSYKPGDVYTSYTGKTVEIGNTDAEGRLVLADALAYANKKLKPTRIIDFATLTGAVIISLGEETTGLMSNDEKLENAIKKAGEATFERVWSLPLFEEYKKQLKSDIADIKNVGQRGAGAITAALFLQEFVGKTPWAHLDIAGTAYLSSARRYHPKNGTGVGVRLMIEFLHNI